MVPISKEGQLVYDRALRGHAGTRVGDQQLAQLLPVHGWIMRSGVLALDEAFSIDRIRRAAAALDYFGLIEAGQLLRRIPGADLDADRMSGSGTPTGDSSTWISLSSQPSTTSARDTRATSSWPRPTQ